MKCKLCEDKILEYLYGELGEEEAASMEQHLEASEACRRAYEGFASVLDTVAESDEEGPSPALHTRIMGHAEDARPGRRSLRAWIFRPAVTTAVIGAVAAGVYFTTLRHKPPSYLDERRLSEQSPVMSKVEALKKEAKEEGFLSGLAEPPAAIEQEEAAPEPLGVPEKEAPVRVKAPSGSQDRFTATDSLDEEFATAPPLKKSKALKAEEDRTVAGGRERAPSPTDETRAVPMALSASPGRDLDAEKTPVPRAIERVLHLASQGQCAEAGKTVEAYTTDHPKEEASGTGWLKVARCYAKKGDIKAAREMAEKALEIPACESEARSFLDTLPPP